MQPLYDGVLQVEPTDHCNLSCSMCAPHSQGWPTVHAIAKGYLDMALWERIVDGLVADDKAFDHIIFQWLGEPTLHPRIADIIGIAAHRMADRVGYLRLDTNGIRLDTALIDGLVGAAQGPPLLVVFSLDAASGPTYARVKGRDRLDQVRRNIRALVRRRRQVGGQLNLQLQFVVQPGNDHEVGAFLDYWDDLLACQGGGNWHDEVLFKRLSVGGGADGQAAADRLYERALSRAGVGPGARRAVEVKVWEDRPWQVDDAHRGQRGPCPALWLTPVIRQDGHLVMCCADLRGDTVLGSLAEHSFHDLWEGKAATRRRLDHIAGRFTGVCAGCGGINWYETTPEMVESVVRAD